MNATFWDSLCNYAILRSRCAKELHGVIFIFCKKVGNRVGKKLSKAKALTIFYRKGLIFMVRPARFELTAFGSGGQRSIQLSYERIRTFLICFVLAAVKVSRQCQLPRAVTMAIGQQASGAAGNQHKACKARRAAFLRLFLFTGSVIVLWQSLIVVHCGYVCAPPQCGVKICPRGRAPQ